MCYIRSIRLIVMEFCWRLLSFLHHIALSAVEEVCRQNDKGTGLTLLLLLLIPWKDLWWVIDLMFWKFCGIWVIIVIYYTVHTRRTMILKKVTDRTERYDYNSVKFFVRCWWLMNEMRPCLFIDFSSSYSLLWHASNFVWRVENILVFQDSGSEFLWNIVYRAVLFELRGLVAGNMCFQVRGSRIRRQAGVVGSRLAGRLSGVSQRSRVIRRNTGRSVRRQPAVFTSAQVTLIVKSSEMNYIYSTWFRLSFQIVRGRGLSHMGQLASDSEAFMVEQREM